MEQLLRASIGINLKNDPKRPDFEAAYGGRDFNESFFFTTMQNRWARWIPQNAPRYKWKSSYSFSYLSAFAIALPPHKCSWTGPTPLLSDATQKQKAEWWLGFHPTLQWQRRWKPHSHALHQAPSRTRQWKLFARTQFPHAASNLPHDHAAHNTTASRFAPPAPLFTFVCSICRDVLLLPVPWMLVRVNHGNVV
jgi:hypothetical protein